MGMQGILGTQRGNEIIATVPNKDDPGVRDVYFGMAHFTSYRVDDREAKKILVGFLGNSGVRKKAISNAFDMNPCLVTRYSKSMRDGGIFSLLEDGRGRPSKVTEELGVFVRNCYEELRRKGERKIRLRIREKVKERFGVDISRELIRQITISVREGSNLYRESKGFQRKQLPLLSSGGLPVKISNGTNGLKLIKRLEKGFYSRYAGGLLLNIFVARLTDGVLDGYQDSQIVYDLRAFMIMIIQMVQFDIVNIERVKRIKRREFGLLLGVEASPGLKTMRRKLSEAVERLDMEKISIRLAQNYLSNLSLGTDVFYVDDHLETYSGKNKVLLGFSHVYDRMMEGIQHSFVHDRWGNPICFELRDNFNNFREYLPVMVKRVKSIYRGRRKPTFVFDRSGYDQRLFEQFDKGLGAYYIVWAKADRTDYERESLKFDEVEFYFRGNSPGRPRKVTLGIAELPRIRGPIKQRRIVLRRRASRRLKGKREYMYSSLVTNDMRREKEEIVEHLIYRWREECDFKVEVNECGIDQIMSYMMEDYREDIFSQDDLLASEFREGKVMKNPMLKSLFWMRGKIKREIAKIDQQLGRWTFTQSKNRERPISEAMELKRNKDALARRDQLKGQLEEIEKKIASLPERVNRLESLIYGKFKTFNFRKKLIMDTLKVCARNVRRMALEVLDHHYKNYRDQLDFLRRIIRNGGYIKLNGRGMVIVDIVPFDTEAENIALANFLKEINEAKPRMFGDNPLPIKFRVGRT